MGAVFAPGLIGEEDVGELKELEAAEDGEEGDVGRDRGDGG